MKTITTIGFLTFYGVIDIVLKKECRYEKTTISHK